MKNILVSTLLVLGISSCSKDSLDSAPSNALSIEKSAILVTVTYLTWNDQNCDLGCGGNGTQTVSFIANAQVDLYSGDISASDVAGHGTDFGNTDKEGSILFEDLDPGQYTILVDTPYGQKSRTIYTQLNKRSSIEFSF
jgi:hypothetical protein